jgi:PIN domain nuclease of toxin-antitoxin system
LRLLLDTHIFLWFAFGSPKLSQSARELIEDPAHETLLSIASVWETSIKVGIGKLQIKQPVEEFFREQMVRQGIGLLPITMEHAARVSLLPTHHRDPFDRLLVAQSLTEYIPILSADSVLDAYKLTRLF